MGGGGLGINSSTNDPGNAQSGVTNIIGGISSPVISHGDSWLPWIVAGVLFVLLLRK
jgi:hypothetical protein